MIKLIFLIKEKGRERECTFCREMRLQGDQTSRRLLLRRNNLFRYRTHPSLLIFTVIFTTQLRIYMLPIVDKSAKVPGHHFQFPRPIDERNFSSRPYNRTTPPRDRSCPCPVPASVVVACLGSNDRPPSPLPWHRRRRRVDVAPAAASADDPALLASASATWRDDF